MKKQHSALAILSITLGALAIQSCEYTDGDHTLYNRGHSGYYHDGRYAADTGYYHQRHYYNGDNYESDRPAIDLRF